MWTIDSFGAWEYDDAPLKYSVRKHNGEWVWWVYLHGFRFPDGQGSCRTCGEAKAEAENLGAMIRLFGV